MTADTFTDTTLAVRDWLRDHATDLGVDSTRIDLGTKPGPALQIALQRVGGGDDASEAYLDLAMIQLDVWHGGTGTQGSYSVVKNAKNKLRALLKGLRGQALSTGPGNATFGYGASVLVDRFLPDEDAKAVRASLTVTVTARAT